MIYELKKSQFKNVAHLLVGDRCNVEIKSIVESNNPGWIFADDYHKPKTAMVWSQGIEGFYFIGDERNPEFNHYINEYIHKTIAPRAKELGLDWFECNGINEKWDKTLEEIFAQNSVKKSWQYVYKFENLKSYPLDEMELKGDYQVRKIDRELLDEGISNKEFLTSEIELFWDSVDDFLQKGIGFCIMNDDLVVSRCISSFISQNTHAIGIETLEGYRKKGLARKATLKMLKCQKEHNLLPYWDCMETNTPSSSLAESVGFQRAFKYPLYEFKI